MACELGAYKRLVEDVKVRSEEGVLNFVILRPERLRPETF